jgi:steroid delta-isomerase-like uncharacterized protein
LSSRSPTPCCRREERIRRAGPFALAIHHGRWRRCQKRPIARSYARFIDEIFNARNFDAVDEILTTDYVHHDPTTQEFGSGIEGFKRFVGYYRDAFPDLQIVFDDQFAAGDRVVGRWTGRGTHRGELMGVPATDRPVSATGISTPAAHRGTNSA